jgi:hypothetical protein
MTENKVTECQINLNNSEMVSLVKFNELWMSTGYAQDRCYSSEAALYSLL